MDFITKQFTLKFIIKISLRNFLVSKYIHIVNIIAILNYNLFKKTVKKIFRFIMTGIGNCTLLIIS